MDQSLDSSSIAASRSLSFQERSLLAWPDSENAENQTRNRNEVLMTYGDHLDISFGDVLRADFEDPWWKEQSPWSVSRDVHNPWHHNEGEYLYDPW